MSDARTTILDHYDYAVYCSDCDWGLVDTEIITVHHDLEFALETAHTHTDRTHHRTTCVVPTDNLPSDSDDHDNGRDAARGLADGLRSHNL